MPNPPLPALPSYGADDHGLICAFRFLPGQPAQPVATMAEALPAPPAPGFVWLHVNLSQSGTEAGLRRFCGLDESFFDALADGSRSTRIERVGEALFAVMNDVTFDFSFDPGDLATLWVWVQSGLVVSARRHPLRSVDRLRVAVKRGDEIGSSVELLDHLLGDQCDELQRIVRRAAERIDDIEDEVLAGHHDQHTAELAQLRRLMVRLQRLLAPEPSALQRTLAHPPAWVRGEDREHLHRASEEFALVLADVASLQDRVKLMQDEAATRVNEENNRSLFTLTMVTVLALPINLIAGLLGMNVGGIPFSGSPHGFWLTLGLIGALTGLIAWIALARIRARSR